MTPPCVAQAAVDAAVSDASYRLLVVLAEHLLDPMEFRPLKHELVRTQFRRKRQTIAWGLKQLELTGYLRCGARDPAAPALARSERPLWYRLVWTREDPTHRPPWHQA